MQRQQNYSSNANLDQQRWQFLRLSVLTTLIVASTGLMCEPGLNIGDPLDPGSPDNQDTTNPAQVIEISSLQVMSWDVPQANENFQGSTTMVFVMFDRIANATSYRAVFESTTSPTLEFDIMWDEGEPVPDPAVPVFIIPGYVDGLIGDEYFLEIATTGCQGGREAGGCALDGETTLIHEERSREVMGKVTITASFD